MIPLVTRIAPSPTGDMHLGTARTAYFNWLAARSTGGTFILRIDDTDLARSDDKFSQVILDTMDWLGLDYDKLIYQSQRFDVYRDVAEKLVKNGQAQRTDDAIVLFPIYPENINDSWHDDIAGNVVISNDDKKQIGNGIVLIKGDGSPTYHFASVVDDIQFGINFVIRGKDHTTNTARQVALYSCLKFVLHDYNYSLPRYAHIGLIRKDGAKLSKRDGAASMLSYREKGYDSDAMLNFMARLGWGPTVDDKTTTLLPREKMLQLFLSGGKMKNSDANMDMAKLDSFDKKYKGRKRVQT